MHFYEPDMYSLVPYRPSQFLNIDLWRLEVRSEVDSTIRDNSGSGCQK